MRVKAIELSWFRGAADPVSLDPDGKSMVVYGVNGSGKSSFVDAIEYVLNDGKIGHLAHEYSGRRQEKAIPNTHTPSDRKTELKIRFKDDSELKTEISKGGVPTTTGANAGSMSAWDYRRTVLRQDEVAAFIAAAKGNKYSSLLPLLGLHQMEVAAENLRQLAKHVTEESKLKELKPKLKAADVKRKEVFGTDTDAQIFTKVELLHKRYCAGQPTATDILCRCKEIKLALDSLVEASSSDQRRYIALRGVTEFNLQKHIDDIRFASSELAGSVEPLVDEKLEVLQSARLFASKLAVGKEVQCPACGKCIAVDAFQAHVKDESERLQGIIDVFEVRKASVAALCDTVRSIKTTLGKDDVKIWRDGVAKGPHADNLLYLDKINSEALRTSCSEEDLKAIETHILPLIVVAESDSKDAPPDAMQITKDTRLVETAMSSHEAISNAADVARAEGLISFVSDLEQGMRDEIRERSQAVIDEISTSIQVMWSILHPSEAIEKVHLYLPEDSDKAIDIGLTFFGVEQESPRLTLSEGHRNSLGLCIFLAMAQREESSDRPLFLDDVVVSLDRSHRGMIVELLEKIFAQRQVIILTHDREWYAELRQQLDAKEWLFKTLLPYVSPELGIRWAHKMTTFDDARAQLMERPDSAGNDARKIMDVELALIAERLQIKLPYIRGDRNDKRMAHDFLVRFAADGKKCFLIREDAEHVVFIAALETFDKVDRLLISWANRASHTFDLVHSEANKLIEACEQALEFFKCPSCRKGVWFADVGSAEFVQCECGKIRWRYGKG